MWFGIQAFAGSTAINILILNVWSGWKTSAATGTYLVCIYRVFCHLFSFGGFIFSSSITEWSRLEGLKSGPACSFISSLAGSCGGRSILQGGLTHLFAAGKISDIQRINLAISCRCDGDYRHLGDAHFEHSRFYEVCSLPKRTNQRTVLRFAGHIRSASITVTSGSQAAFGVAHLDVSIFSPILTIRT